MKSHNFSLFMNHNQISKMKDERWNFSKQFSWKKIYICCLQLVTFLYPRIKLLLTQSLTFYNEGNYNFKESVSNTGQSHIIFWSFSIFSTLRLSIEHTSYQPKTKAFAMERERERVLLYAKWWEDRTPSVNWKNLWSLNLPYKLIGFTWKFWLKIVLPRRNICTTVLVPSIFYQSCMARFRPESHGRSFPFMSRATLASIIATECSFVEW